MLPFSLSDAGWLFEPSVHPCLVSFCMVFISDCEFPCPFTVKTILDRWDVTLRCYVCVLHVCTHVCRSAHQCSCNVEARSWCWNAFLNSFYALFFSDSISYRACSSQCQLGWLSTGPWASAPSARVTDPGCCAHGHRGSEFWFLCLCKKHLTHWAVSLAPPC